jgi:hypothetical protein
MPDPMSTGGGFAFIALLIIGGFHVGWLERQRSAAPSCCLPRS